jgi:hypothetical protein
MKRNKRLILSYEISLTLLEVEAVGHTGVVEEQGETLDDLLVMDKVEPQATGTILGITKEYIFLSFFFLQWSNASYFVE